MATGGGDGYIASAADYEDGTLHFTIGDVEEVVDGVVEANLTAEDGDNFYPLNADTSIDFYNESIKIRR